MEKIVEELKFKNPKKLIVYSKARELNRLIYQLVRQFPKEETFAMSAQLRRACTSIGANIVEGNGQVYPAKEFNFINNALGSAHETLYWLELAQENEYITPEQFKKIDVLLAEVIRMLMGVMKKLNGD